MSLFDQVKEMYNALPECKKGRYNTLIMHVDQVKNITPDELSLLYFECGIQFFVTAKMTEGNMLLTEMSAAQELKNTYL